MGYGLMGFKSLVHWNGENYSVMHSERWLNGQLVARCFRPGVGPPRKRVICDVPERTCQCGIYAAAPCADPAIRYITTKNMILVVVRAHDKVVRHERGWRAKIAEIVAVVRPESEWCLNLYYAFELPAEPSVLAARLTDVPLIDMAAASALVESSWDSFSRRLPC